jgi:hypothetical protein
MVTPQVRAPDVFLTEHGYFSAGRRAVPDATRARWLTESFEIALANPRVRQLVQYLLVTPPVARNTFPTQIMSRRGGPQKPYTALRKWTRRNRKRLAPPYVAPTPTLAPEPTPSPTEAPEPSGSATP